jgi:hypothetical protein
MVEKECGYGGNWWCLRGEGGSEAVLSVIDSLRCVGNDARSNPTAFYGSNANAVRRGSSWGQT